MAKDNKYIFKGGILSRTRKKLGISIEDIAAQLTLSEDQIISIEKNLNHGFITSEYKKLAITRYAKILGIELTKIIIPRKNPPQESENTISENVKPNLKKHFSVITFFTICFLLIFILTKKNKPSEVRPNSLLTDLENEIIEEIVLIENSKNESLPIINTEKLAEKKEIKPDKDDEKIIVPQTDNSSPYEFLCTIQTAAVKEFTTKNPEKPSTYFHLIALENQSFCTIDNLGNFKTFHLKKEERVTFRGQAPFKIQLDPKKSRLFFQGWIVHPQHEDHFIQLNPVNFTEE